MKLSKLFLVSQRTVWDYIKKSWIYSCLGLFSVSAIFVFQESIQTKISQDGKKILSADLRISKRGKWIEPPVQYLEKYQDQIQSWHENIEVATMIRNDQDTLLVNVIAADLGYPFYDSEIQTWFQSDFSESKSVVISQEVSDRLSIGVGASLIISDTRFTIKRVLNPDNMSFRFQAFVPQIFIAKSDLKDLNIIGAMSSENRRVFVKLRSNVVAEDFSKTLKLELGDSSLRIRTFKDNNLQSTRILERLNQFIAIIALICLLYAFIGSLFSFRQYIIEQIPNVLTLKILGYSNRLQSFLWLCKIVQISLIYFLAVSLIHYIVFNLLSNSLGLTSFELELNYKSLAYTLVLSIIFHLMIYLSYRKNFSQIDGSRLLRGGNFGDNIRFSKLSLLFSFVIFYLLAFYLSNSFMITNVFVVAIFAISIVLYCCFLLLTKILRLFVKKPLLRFIHILMVRNKATYISLFFSMILGLTITQLIPQIAVNIENELKVTDKPSLFFFDVQEEQLDDFKKFLSSEVSQNLKYVSPMVRARLLKINDEEILDNAHFYVDSEESRNSKRFRNRAFNLSYRSELSPSENIINGEPLDTYRGEYFPVSLEQRFARRTGIKIGDKLDFDILGQTVSVEVHNIRSINWFSFQPNFFVQFGESAINQFPKTFLATVSNLSISEKRQLQYQINKSFNNISSVDLDIVIDRILKLLSDFKNILNFVAYFSFFIGIIVFLAIYRHFIELRQNEVVHLKLLGVSQKKIFQTFFTEVSIQFVFCSLLSILSAGLLSNYIIVGLFNIPWSFVLLESLLVICVYFLFTIVGFRLFYRRFFNKSPLSVLRK